MLSVRGTESSEEIGLFPALLGRSGRHNHHHYIHRYLLDDIEHPRRLPLAHLNYVVSVTLVDGGGFNIDFV